MRVCSGILLLTLLNPVEVAENAATLDAITDGRFVLGLGLGYRQEENDAFGLPEQRLRIFEQKLDVVRAAARGRGRDRGGARLPARASSSSRCGRRRLRGRRSGSPRTTTRPSCGRRAWPTPGCSTRTRSWPSSSASSASTTPSASAAACAPAAEIPIIKELYVGDDDESAMRAVRPFLEDKYKAYVQWGQSEVLPEGDTLRQEFERARGGRALHRRRARDLRPPGARARRAARRDELPLPLPVARHAAGARARLDAARGRGGLPAALSRRPRSPPRRARRGARSRPRPSAARRGISVSARPAAAQAVQHGRRRDVGDREAPAAGPRRGVVEQALERLELGQRRREGAAAAVGVGRLGAEPPAGAQAERRLLDGEERRPQEGRDRVQQPVDRRAVGEVGGVDLRVARAGREVAQHGVRLGQHEAVVNRARGCRRAG